MSYGEPIALRGQMELEQVAPAAVADVRPSLESQFIERLKRGDAAAFEKLVNERSGEIYGLLYRLTENGEEARDLTQESFLRQVACFFTVFSQAIKQTVNLAGAFIHQFFEGSSVAAL